MFIVNSINDVPIRLTEERWYEHIIENHPELSGHLQSVLSAIEEPDFILRGRGGAKVAIINMGRKKWLQVVYRETGKRDGFIISAHFESYFDEELIIWRSDNY